MKLSTIFRFAIPREKCTISLGLNRHSKRERKGDGKNGDEVRLLEKFNCKMLMHNMARVEGDEGRKKHKNQVENATYEGHA